MVRWLGGESGLCETAVYEVGAVWDALRSVGDVEQPADQRRDPCWRPSPIRPPMSPQVVTFQLPLSPGDLSLTQLCRLMRLAPRPPRHRRRRRRTEPNLNSPVRCSRSSTSRRTPWGDGGPAPSGTGARRTGPPTSQPSYRKSRLLRKVYDAHVRRYLWGGHFWSGSYFAGSCRGAPPTVVPQYIENSPRPERRSTPQDRR
ncbi:transposase [Streptomyces solisilvae]|uniref:transposase n=1 Tax=Streptomyces malaysiensis TaxID=92644 RepID=UPI00371B68FF